METSILQHPSQSPHRTWNSIVAGALAGMGGGIVFGMMMAMMGMLPMIAGMVGSSSALIGLFVHLVISTFIGATYGLVASRLPAKLSVHLMAGMANGIVWWVLGALVLMPIALGMSGMVLAIGSKQLISLMGHLIYGVVTAFLFTRIYQRV